MWGFNAVNIHLIQLLTILLTQSDRFFKLLARSLAERPPLPQKAPPQDLVALEAVALIILLTIYI
jgi:hypothetical protein